MMPKFFWPSARLTGSGHFTLQFALYTLKPHFLNSLLFGKFVVLFGKNGKGI